MEAYNELDIINQIRGKAMHKPNVTGRNPFLVWGYSIVVAYFLTFAAMMLWDNPWCLTTSADEHSRGEEHWRCQRDRCRAGPASW